MKLLFYFVFLPIFVFAQSVSDDTGAALLQQVEKKYNSLKNYEIQFKLESTEAEQKPKTIIGFYIKSQEAFKFKSPDQEIFCDGKQQWTVLHKQKEIQIGEPESDSNPYNPSYILSSYKKKYESGIDPNTKDLGANQVAIEFKPKDKNQQIIKVRLIVDKKTKLIKKMHVYERNGNRSVFTIQKHLFNTKYSISHFTLDTEKYAGYHIEDIRI